MKGLAKLLFEANMLKRIPRSGYPFLGAGKESIAEHSFLASFVAYTLSMLAPDADALKLISMSVVHDLPEARTGDLNYVQKRYLSADESRAVRDMTRDILFGSKLKDLLDEFKQSDTREAQLAHDADQIALILDLKALCDIGYTPPAKWLPHVVQRLKTAEGKKLCKSILETNRDDWWLDNAVDRTGEDF